MNKKRNENGITVIALIISIIAILVIVGVLILVCTKVVQKRESTSNEGNENILETENKNENVNITSTKQSKKSSSKTISATEYGDSVDYSVTIEGTTLDDWKIFYTEGENVFIIYGGYLPNAVLGDINTTGTISNLAKLSVDGEHRVYWKEVPEFQTITNDILTLFKGTEYGLNSSYDNSKVVSTLLNTSNWDALLTNKLKKKAGEDKVKAIGGPTVEMWMESWNEVYPDDILNYQKASYGYEIKTSKTQWSSYLDRKVMNIKEGYNNKLYYPYNEFKDSKDGGGYWLASPSDEGQDYIMYECWDGYLSYNTSKMRYACIRPVICIPSSIFDDKDENGKWQLKLN